MIRRRWAALAATGVLSPIPVVASAAQDAPLRWGTRKLRELAAEDAPLLVQWPATINEPVPLAVAGGV